MPRQKQINEEDATVIDDALSVNSSSDEDEDEDDSDEDDQDAIVGQIYWCNGYEQVLV